MDIKQALDFYSKNPNDARKAEFDRRLKSGRFNDKLEEAGLALVGNEIKSVQTPTTDSGFQRFAQGVEEYAPGGKLAKGIASSLSIPIARKSLEDTVSTIDEQNTEIIAKMKDAREEGEDTSKYRTILQSNQKLIQDSINALDNELNTSPTTGEVIGGAAELATMAVPGGVAGGLGKKVAVGAATGYAGDVATNLADGKSGTDAFTPGISTAIGTGVPIVGAGAKIGVKVLKEVAPEVASKVSKLVKLPKNVAKATGEIASDIVGTKQGAVNSLIARSLKLAPVEDINRISNLIGEDIGTKMSTYNLIKNTPDKTENALKKFAKDNYNLKNDLISLVDEQFTKQEIPEIQDLTELLIPELNKTKSPQYRQALDRLANIAKSETVSLEDVNYVRSVFDDVESVYTRSGDVRDQLMASDKANLANKVREFIDNRVAEVYPDASIREISKNIMFGRAMEDAIIKRSGKFDTQSPLALTDLFVLGIPNDPITGAALLATKKIAGSAPIKLRVAQAISNSIGEAGLGVKKQKELSSMVAEELRKSFDFIEKTK